MRRLKFRFDSSKQKPPAVNGAKLHHLRRFYNYFINSLASNPYCHSIADKWFCLYIGVFWYKTSRYLVPNYTYYFVLPPLWSSKIGHRIVSQLHNTGGAKRKSNTLRIQKVYMLCCYLLSRTMPVPWPVSFPFSAAVFVFPTAAAGTRGIAGRCLDKR